MRFLALGILALASLLPLWAMCVHPGTLNDDSLITLTYSKNLAAGRGFVYNHPPATLGTTTPLLALAAAVPKALRPSLGLEAIAVAISALAWLGIPWLFYAFRSSWGLGEWQSAVVGVSSTLPAWLGTLGMETYPFAFLMVLALSLAFAGRHLLAGLGIGLLFLTRGEGALVLGVVALHRMIADGSSRRRIGRESLRSLAPLAIGFAVPAGAWSLYGLATFGHALPNTLVTGQAWMESTFGATLPQRLWHDFLPRWGDHLALAGLDRPVLWWALVGWGTGFALWRRHRLASLVVWSVFYLIGYAVLGVSAQGWYQYPILFVANVMFGLGLVQCAHGLGRLSRPRHAGVALAVCLVGVLLLRSAWPSIAGIRDWKPLDYADSYRNLARWFRENADPGASIAYMEIGYLGFYTPNPIIDPTGILDREVATHMAEGDFSWAVWHSAPDYYVWSPVFAPLVGPIQRDVRFLRTYQPVAQLPGRWQRPLVIFARRDGPQVAAPR